MNWTYQISDQALTQLKKLDPESRRRILRYLERNIYGSDNPRQFGKALTGDLKNLWRYRTSHYRILCEIRDQELVVLVVKAGHRKDIYD